MWAEQKRQRKLPGMNLVYSHNVSLFGRRDKLSMTRIGDVVLNGDGSRGRERDYSLVDMDICKEWQLFANG